MNNLYKRKKSLIKKTKKVEKNEDGKAVILI